MDALMPDQVHKRTIYDHIQVMETHARQLELELAEVNEKLREHASMLKSSDAHNNDMFCKLEKERELHSETKSELAEVTKQRDHYKKACNQYSEDEILCKLHEATKQRDALADALKRIMKLTTPDQNMPYCKDDRIHGIAGGALAATKKGKP
jgi:membrane protein involved in colicin uptake